MSHDRFQALTDEQLDRIDAACSDLEESWKRGNAASIEQQLAGVDPDVRSLLLRELLAAEIELRRSCGELPHPAEYEVRFPDHVEQIQEAFGFAGDGGSTVELTLTAIYDGKSLTKTHDRAGDQAGFVSVDGLPQQFGRYLLVRLLGRGGMGSVYLAHDQELDRDVAIKFPVFDKRPEFNAVERFRREARAMAALHHPNLCPVYDVGQLDGRHYLTMAYLEGHTLTDAQLSQSEAIRIVSSVARALQSAHEAGVVHRDLKPANVMLNPRGEPIVMDFGLASRDAASEAELTHSGLIIGSPAYMAPEQVKSEHDQIGPRTDVYALGVILYQLLTRRRPFEGAGLSVLGQISSGQRPLPPSKLADVNPRLEAICLKAMAHRIEDRYQSAAELAVALDDYTSKPLEEPVPQVRRSNTKLRTTAVGIAALVLLALLINVIKITLTGPSKEAVNESPIAARPGHSQTLVVAVEKSPLVSADYEWSEPVNLGAGANSEWEEDHPTVTADGLTLIFMRQPDGQPAQLWQSTREDIAQPFGAAVKLFEDATSYDWCPFLSHDGLTLWFHSTRPIAPNRSDQNVWVTHRRSLAEPFEKPQPLGSEINTTKNEGNAFVSADGLTLLFTRGNPEQIFQATRQSESDDFSNARLLDAGFDGAWNGFPRLNADGRALLFVSNLTGHCIWLATRESVDAKFGRPTQLDATINVGEVSGPFLSADEKTLYFSSIRAGGIGRRDLWSSTRIPVAQAARLRSTDANVVLPTDRKAGEPPALRNATASPTEASLPQDLAQLGTGVFGPKIAADGLSLWFHAPADIANGDSRLVLWQAWRHATNEPFAAPVRADGLLNNQPDHNLSDATLSADGLVLSFCRTKTESGSNSDIWLSTRPSGDASWTEPVSAGAAVNSEHGEWEPELSPNGLELFFHSNRPNGNGGTDLWVSRRATREAEFGPAENLGPEINSQDIEGGAALSSAGLTLIFHRFNANGVSLWRATRKSLDAAFEAPQRVTIPLMADEQFISVSLSASGEELYGQRRSHNRTSIAMSRLKPALADGNNFSLRVSPGVHVEMPSLKLDPAAPHTIEAWVTPPSRVQGDKHVFGWPQASSLFVKPHELSWTFGLDRTNAFQFVKEPQPITPSRRVHVAIVRSGKEMRLFVDGQRVDSEQEHESPPKNQSQPFSLSIAGSTAFSGDYDEVRVSRIARYDENFEPQLRLEPDADTLALYHCDENGGDQLLDSSANNHHGKITGQAKWIEVIKAAANADAP